MTDKEIIIDSVDVSECDHLKYDHIGCDIDETYCLGSDCYFKQLKRKEQECKNLEEELRGCRIGIKDISIENTEICKISEKYKQAIDEIENYVRDNSDFDKSDKLTSNTGAYDIL